jgi:hypothetical protein
VTLSPAETSDKSAPAIDATVKVEKIDQDARLKAIEKGADLKHVETVDKAAPHIGSDVHIKKIDKDARLNEIAEGNKLLSPRGTTETVDKSAPKLPSAANVHDIKAVVADVAKGATDLKHVETVDKAAPKIEDNVTIKKIDKGARLEEIAKGADLKHVETVDKAAPKIEDVKIKNNEMPKLKDEISKSGKVSKQ